MIYKNKRKVDCMKSEDKPILAICYDFDKTLSPDDMQAQGYIQSIDYEVADFWKESNELAAKNDMDQNLAYMYMMLRSSEGKVLFTKDTLRKEGAKVKLFPGVNTWFDRINQYGEENGVIVEHYIISSGLKEMIEGTEVADKFKRYMQVLSILMKKVLQLGLHRLLIIQIKHNFYLGLKRVF